jgi:osmotically-inducible protein OsmY
LNSVVTLTGIADSAIEKELFKKLITDMNGFSDVVNNMTVQES